MLHCAAGHQCVVAGKCRVQAREAEVGTSWNDKDVDWASAGSRSCAISDTARVDICATSLERIWAISFPSAQGPRRDWDVAHVSCVYEVILMFNVYKETGRFNLCPVYKDVLIEMIQILTKNVQS